MTEPPGADTPFACPVCRTPAVPGARFCHQCGAPLGHAEPVPEGHADRRVVTVLFGDLSDFTAWAEDLDPERVGVVTDRVLVALAKAVTDVGGRVDKLTGDGIMAVFGAPTSHEDDAERAVRAAAQMQSQVRRLIREEAGGGRRMGLRVGVNTGEVLAGVQAHLAYTVVGDTVNTASRLSDAAGVGTVYAGRDTALATMHIASWRALPPLRLKGKREPVAAYELVGLRPPGTARVGIAEEAQLIGRDAEFGRLAGLLIDAFDRREPMSVLVTGEAGVGKTRLVAELARFAGELPDARVLWGRCTPYGEGREFAPLAQWVRTACGVDHDDDAETAVRRVRRTVARVESGGVSAVPPSVTATRLLALLGVSAPQPPGPRETATPGVVAPHGDPVVDAVAGLLCGLAREGPLLLVVDDLQWAGRELAATLHRLAGQLAGPAFLACVGRAEQLHHDRDWWRQLPAPVHLPLAPLSGPAAERLLRAYLGGADLAAEASGELLARAQGNPFFLAELLHLLVDRGLLRREGAGWRLEGRLPADVLPAGVQAVLAARIDGLDPPARMVLRDAAVLGARFRLEALLAVATAGEDDVRRAVAELVARGLVVPRQQPDDAEPTYAFAHTLARDVAYAGIPKAERARRHAQVAAWAATAPPGQVPDGDEFVAAQAEQAVLLAREMGLPGDDPAWQARRVGFEAFARLGRAAAVRDDHLRADGLLTRAFEVGGEEATGVARLPVLVARAAARAALHRIAEAEADLVEPLAGPPWIRAQALVVAGEIRRRRGEEAQAKEALVSALAAAAESGNDRVTGEALRQLGLIDYLGGRLADAEGRFRQALEVAERVGDQRGAGWALQHLAWSATTRGDYQVAEAVLARAAAVFSDLEDGGGLSWCAGTEAFVRLLQGRLRQARELAGGLLPVGEAMGDRWGVAACLTIDAFAAAELGEVGVAESEAERAHRLFVELGDTWGQAMALVSQGAAKRGLGDTLDAIRLLRRAVAASEAGHHPVTASLALGILGYCHLDRGELAEAAAAAAGALDALQGLDVRPAAMVGPVVLRAQVLRAQGALDEALRLLHEVAGTGGEASLLFPRRQALAHLAGATLAAGRPAEAFEVARRALEAPAEDVRSRVVALRVLGACLEAQGDRPAARFALRQAVAMARSTEQVGEREPTERALAAVGG